MTFAVIIRRHDGFQSYLLLDEQPREFLRHPGFQEEFSIRGWRGSLDPVDAREEWCEMLGEDIELYTITDSDNWEFCHDLPCWDRCAR